MNFLIYKQQCKIFNEILKTIINQIDAINNVYINSIELYP